MGLGFGLQRAAPYRAVDGRTLVADYTPLAKGLAAGMMANKQNEMRERQIGMQQQKLDLAQAEMQRVNAEESQSAEALKGLLSPREQYSPGSGLAAREVGQVMGGLPGLAPAAGNVPVDEQTSGQIVGELIQGGLAQTQEDNMQGLRDANRAALSKQAEQVSQVFKTNPQAAFKVFESINATTKEQVAAGADFAKNALNASYEDQTQMIKQRAEEVFNRGGDASDTLELLDMSPEQRNQTLMVVDQAAGVVLGTGQKPVAPTSLMKNLQASGLEPGSPEYQEAVRNDLAGGTPEELASKAALAEGKAKTEALKAQNEERKYNQSLAKMDEKERVKARGIHAQSVESTRLLDLAKEALDHPGRPKATGIGKYTRGYLPGDAKNYENKHNSLMGILTLDNLIEAKSRGATFGALSEKELGLIAAAAANLNLSQTDGEYKENLNKLIGRLENSNKRQKDFEQSYVNKNKPKGESKSSAKGVVKWGDL